MFFKLGGIVGSWYSEVQLCDASYPGCGAHLLGRPHITMVMLVGMLQELSILILHVGYVSWGLGHYERWGLFDKTVELKKGTEWRVEPTGCTNRPLDWLVEREGSQSKGAHKLSQRVSLYGTVGTSNLYHVTSPLCMYATLDTAQ